MQEEKQNNHVKDKTLLDSLSMFGIKKYHSNLLTKITIAPSIASIAEKIILHPLDTIIVFQQKKNIAFIPAIHHIYKDHGFWGYYKGLSLTLMFSAPPNMILAYGTYEGFKEALSHKTTLSRTEHFLISSIMPSFFLSILSTPIEAKRIRDTFGIKITESKHIVSYYYRGFIPNTVKMLLSGIFILAGTDIFRDKLNLHGKESQYKLVQKLSNINQPYTAFFCGLMTGTLVQIFTAPFDTIKTKMMSNYMSGDLKLSLWQCAVRSYQEKNLFAGLMTKMGRSGLQCSFMLGFMTLFNQIILENFDSHYHNDTLSSTQRYGK